jgi:putative transposase
LLRFTSRKPIASPDEFTPDSFLFITAGTFQKKPFIAGDGRRAMLLESLDFNCYKWDWKLVAYVILDNHYHLVVRTPAGDDSRLAHIVQSAHSFSAYHWRREDPSIRSRIWWNFWEMPIASPALLVAHINYVHDNPRFHGLVDDPAEFTASSYADYLALDADKVRRWEADYPGSSLTLVDGF